MQSPVNTPPFLVEIVGRFFVNGYKILSDLTEKIILISLDIITVKHPWQSPCTWRNMSVCRLADFKTISVHSRALAVRFFLMLWFPFWCHGDDWGCGVVVDVDNGLGKCIIPIGSGNYARNGCLDSCHIFSFFSESFHIPCYKKD